MFKKPLHQLLTLLIFALFAAAAVEARPSDDGVWTEISAKEKSSTADAARTFVPEAYRTFRLNKAALHSILRSALEENEDVSGLNGAVLTLPMPDGSFQRFRIEHSLVVEPGLLKKFPELGATYRGFGIDDPTASVRFDMMPTGFHSIILSEKGTVLVDPQSPGNTTDYISFYKRDAGRRPNFSCEFADANSLDTLIKPKKAGFREFLPEALHPDVSSGTQLRTYRLALAATGEYTATAGGTVAGALAAQVVVMNRVNGVYERDLAIRLVIIANNNLIIYTNGTTDPYTNNNGQTMLAENQTNIDSVITQANYDIGHVFSTAGGGIATLNGPCGANRARGVTGLPNPTGDVFAIDFVAHEMGHQFGAAHTFNATTGNCSGSNRSAGSAYEPGSGISIMGYAGICGSQDLAGNSIDSFHVKSLESIISFSQTGNGNTCAAISGTLNTPPNVNVVGGNTFNIPRLTPFTLTASSSDANGDTVTYDWQQYDLGAGTTAVPNTDSDGETRPLFRVYSPTTNPSRTFPSMQYVLANGNVPPSTTNGFLTGELLPSIARTMNFQVIARDNRANGGGINTASVAVNVSSGGPFRVSVPNAGETWYLNSTPTISWAIGGSDGAPVSAANVKITLSTDGGQTFPIVLAESTPNDGSFTVNSPNLATNQARVKIEAVGNIFFDVSDANFNIVQSAATSGILAGRIATASGQGVPNVYVILTGGSPAITRIAFTNAFGYYQFFDVPFGQFTITPQPRKRFTFAPLNTVRDHNADALNVDFTGVMN